MRSIILPANFHQYDFKKLSRKESNPKNRIRLLAMQNIKEGLSLKAISKVLKVHWKTIQNWLRCFRKDGISGLYVKKTKFKPTKLNDEIKLWIHDFMKAMYSNQVGGSITGKQLLHLVKQHFAIECCLQTIYNTLHRMNLSWISCRSKHPKSEAEVQKLYKKTLAVLSKN